MTITAEQYLRNQSMKTYGKSRWMMTNIDTRIKTCEKLIQPITHIINTHTDSKKNMQKKYQ